MAEIPASLVMLETDEAPPEGCRIPPRQPRWWDTLAYAADPDRFCRSNLNRYGSEFRTSVFGGVAVFVGSRPAVQMALNGDNVYSEVALPATTSEMFGEYSLFQRPELHRRRKSALSPAFSGRMLAGYVPRIHRVIRDHLKRWPEQGRLPLLNSVDELCFDLLVPLLLGVEVEPPEADLGGLPITSRRELRGLYTRFFDGFFGLVRWKSPLTAFGRGWSARTRLISFMEAVIARRRGETANPPVDFLGMMLLDSQDNPDSLFSEALMANQCLLQLWGAHYEVTALICSWMVQVADQPAVLQRLRQELAGLAGADGDPSGVTSEHLRSLTYLDATIRETLRILPPSSTAGRRLTRSVVLDGVLYEKGWTLMAEPRLSHAMADHFPEPQRFDPDRFLSATERERQYAFIPFGGGVHACLGAQMALTIMKVMAIHLLDRFDWQLDAAPTYTAFPLRMIKPKVGIRLTARRGTPVAETPVPQTP